MIVSGGLVIETLTKPIFSDLLVSNFISMSAHFYTPDVEYLIQSWGYPNTRRVQKKTELLL
jgi:hypothetical protein